MFSSRRHILTDLSSLVQASKNILLRVDRGESARTDFTKRADAGFRACDLCVIVRHHFRRSKLACCIRLAEVY